MEAAPEITNEKLSKLPLLSSQDVNWATKRKIGFGGFGKVYRIRIQKWGLDMALKMVLGTREDEIKLMKEARLMEKARFIFVLPLRAFCSYPKGEFVMFGLVTDYMPNRCLKTLLSKVSPVPWALKFRIIHQVALGMNYLHDLKPLLLHLDLKPSNVLLDDNLRVQIADFGLAKTKDITATRTPGNPGTISYMPPEAFVMGYQNQTSFDIYSFGVLIWSVLAAKEPYEGDNEAQLQTNIPKGHRPANEPLALLRDVTQVPEAIALMERCWHQEVAERPTFQECIGNTKGMLEAYEDQVDDAVRCVQDELKKNKAVVG